MKAWLCSWLSGNMLGMGWVQILFWSNYFFLWVIYGNLFIPLVWFLTNEPKLWVDLPLWDGWRLILRRIFSKECISRIFCNSLSTLYYYVLKYAVCNLPNSISTYVGNSLTTRWRFENQIFCAIYQWSFELSQPQKIF